MKDFCKILCELGASLAVIILKYIKEMHQS